MVTFLLRSIYAKMMRNNRNVIGDIFCGMTNQLD